MKFKRIPSFIFIIILFFFLGSLIYWVLVPSFKKNQIIQLLVVKKNEANKIEAAFILFAYPLQKYLYTYIINPEISLLYGKKTKKIKETKDIKALKSFLNQLLNIKINGTIELNDKQIFSLIKKVGIGKFLNLFSDYLPKGEVIINEQNYAPFMASIEDFMFKRDVIYSFWLNFFYQNFSFLKKIEAPYWFLNRYYGLVETSFKRGDFLYLLNQFIFSLDEVYFFKSNMNIEKSVFLGKEIFVPFRNGFYDKNKIRRMIKSFHEQIPSVNKFPISVQVKNMTSYRRLAAKVSGVLHLKKCSVKEYLNSEINVKSSMILDRSGSPLKRVYFSKATKVSNIYFLFDYRENFDFSLYIGEDYYAIPYFEK